MVVNNWRQSLIESRIHISSEHIRVLKVRHNIFIFEKLFKNGSLLRLNILVLECNFLLTERIKIIFCHGTDEAILITVFGYRLLRLTLFFSSRF